MDGAKIQEERSPNSSNPPATCALVHTECHGSPSVAKHASISNSEISWKATSQDSADTEPIHTNIELVGLLTISKNQTIFEILRTK